MILAVVTGVGRQRDGEATGETGPDYEMHARHKPPRRNAGLVEGNGHRVIWIGKMCHALPRSVGVVLKFCAESSIASQGFPSAIRDVPLLRGGLFRRILSQ